MGTGLRRLRISPAQVRMLPHVPDNGGCWVDIYSGVGFSGRLRRFRGPLMIPVVGTLAGSVVVGPGAVVSLSGPGASAALAAKSVIEDVSTLGVATVEIIAIARRVAAPTPPRRTVQGRVKVSC